jgi:hypothetical protein
MMALWRKAVIRWQWRGITPPHWLDESTLIPPPTPDEVMRADDLLCLNPGRYGEWIDHGNYDGLIRVVRDGEKPKAPCKTDVEVMLGTVYPEKRRAIFVGVDVLGNSSAEVAVEITPTEARTIAAELLRLADQIAPAAPGHLEG